MSPQLRRVPVDLTIDEEDVNWPAAVCNMRLFGFSVHCTKPQDHSGDHFNHVARQAWINNKPPSRYPWRRRP